MRDERNRNSELVPIERLEAFGLQWLAVRDDFRNWLLTAV